MRKPMLTPAERRYHPSGKLMGKAPKQAPPDAAEQIKELAAIGHSIVGISQRLGTNQDVLRRWFDEFPELKRAFELGRDRERHMLHAVLHDAAVSGNGRDSLIAAMFLLKSRHGYQEGQQESQANRVSVTFNIPAATPLNQFMTLDNESNDRAERVPAKIVSRA